MWLLHQTAQHSTSDSSTVLNPKAEKWQLKDSPTEDRLTSAPLGPLGPGRLQASFKEEERRNYKRWVQSPFLLIAPFNPVFSENDIQTTPLTKYSKARELEASIRKPPASTQSILSIIWAPAQKAENIPGQSFFCSLNSERSECPSHAAGGDRVCRVCYQRNLKTPGRAISLIWGWQGLQAELMAQLYTSLAE